MTCIRAKTEKVFRFNGKPKLGYCCKMQMAADDTARHQQVADELEKGLRPAECKTCWEAEDNGVESWRQIGNKEKGINKNINDYTYMIEVTLDSTCDLACSYCEYGLSKTWGKEYLSIPKEDRNDWFNKINGLGETPPSASDTYIKETLTKELENVCKTSYYAVCFNIYGGETFLSPFLLNGGIEYLVETYFETIQSDRPLLISLTTNGNTPTPTVKKYIAQYEKLEKLYEKLSFNILISNESVGSTAEFIRYGLNYDTFLENSKLWLESSLNDVMPLMTVNALGITKLADFVEDFNQLYENTDRMKKIVVNPVYEPQEYSIGVLDSRFEIYLDNFIAAIEKNNYDNENIYGADLHKIKNMLGSNLSYKNRLKTFIDYCRIVRNVDFSQIEPEIIKYLEEE